MTGVQHRQAGHLARRAPDAVPLAHHPCPEPAAAGGNAPAGSAVTSAQVGSQSGSQRAQSLGHVRRRHAILVAGDSHAGRHRATSGVRVELIWEQEAAGSNPAIPTRFFECVVSLWKQAATRRQLSPDAGRRGWVAVHVGCGVAPRCRGIGVRPAGRTSVHGIVTRSQASGRRPAEGRRLYCLSRTRRAGWQERSRFRPRGAFISLSCRGADVRRAFRCDSRGEGAASPRSGDPQLECG
jgi:hypothetical protein